MKLIEKFVKAGEKMGVKSVNSECDYILGKELVPVSLKKYEVKKETSKK